MASAHCLPAEATLSSVYNISEGGDVATELQDIQKGPDMYYSCAEKYQKSITMVTLTEQKATFLIGL